MDPGLLPRPGAAAFDRDGCDQGGDSRDRDRGADRADRRPQWALGLRAPGRAGRRRRPHPRRRRPSRRPRGGAALHGRRGHGPDRHLRRPRADRRRPHRGGRRPLRRPRAGPRRGDGGEDRGDPARLRPPLQLRRGSGPRRQSQAGDGARGGDRARSDRHGAGLGRAGRGAGRGRPAGPSARAAADVAVGARHRPGAGGARPGNAAARLHAADVRHPGVGDRQEPAGDRIRRGEPLRPRDHHLPAAGRDRDRRPLPGRRRRRRPRR